jgi:predicted esterase
MNVLSRLCCGVAVCLAGLLAGPAPIHGQTGLRKEVRVAEPTRLDWQFAASAFGKDSARLPAEYDSRRQRYLLYVPNDYKADRPWPLVVFISPGDSPAGWPSWRKVCEKSGILFCSPYEAGNKTPVGQRTRIVLDVLDDVRRHYKIDPDQTYLGGFSGGGRMACTIAFALPEYFGGVVPVCGTNPPPTLTYLRHRLMDRLSVAFVTGATDFNRKENEEYMAPYLRELGVRDRLWVVPGMGHSIPGSEVLSEVFAWLSDDLKRRRQDAKAHPGLAVAPGEAPPAAQQAERLLAEAEKTLKQPKRVWQGVALLQGVRARWPATEAGKQARKRLQEIQDDARLLEQVAEQGGSDERRALRAQAKGLERFGQKKQALQAWELLRKLHPDTPEGKEAAEAVQRLRGQSRRGPSISIDLSRRPVRPQGNSKGANTRAVLFV